MAMGNTVHLHSGQMAVYQAKSRFKVVVAGRRWGKCLERNTLISMSDGTQKPICFVKPGDSVLTVNEGTLRIEPKRVVAVQCNGVRESVKIKTSSRTVVCTPHHPFMVDGQWKQARDIKPKNLLASNRIGFFGNEELPDHIIDILAIWLCDGWEYNIIKPDGAIIDLVREYAAKEGLDLIPINNRVGYFITNPNEKGHGGHGAVSKNALRLLIESYGLWDKRSKTKFIPDQIFRLNKRCLARFLNRMFACDGNISVKSKNTWGIEIGLANEYMVRQVSSLMTKFGIHGQIYHKVHKAKSSVTDEPFESWTYVASDSKDIITFAEEIGAIGKENVVQNACKDALQSRGNCNRYAPISYEQAEPHIAVSDSYIRQQLKTWRKQDRSRMTTLRYEKIRPYMDNAFDPIMYGDVIWEPVVSVEPHMQVETWDLQIEDNHNFFANGIVSHNTQLAKAMMIKYARIPRRLVWYVAPSYRMAKDIMWPELKWALPRKWIKRINETSLEMTLVNGTRIALRGADNPDSLRGVGVHFLVMDEIQDIDPDAWTKVLRPTLASTGGHVLFIGTPKGFSFLYDLYKLGQDGKNRQHHRWMSWQFKTIESPFIPPEEIEAAKSDMDEKSFLQEFEASFLLMSGRVYYSFDREKHLRDDIEFNPDLPIWVGQDFNLDPMSSVIMQPQKDGTVHIVDEIVLHGSNTEEVCDEIEKRYWRWQGNVIIFPDPAGQYGQHARGESDLDIFRERGFKRLRYHKKHPLISDRVNAVNRMLKSADGQTRLFIHPKCKGIINSLEQTIYKQGTREIDKNASVEHSADALGYCIHYQFPTRNLEIVGVSI